MTSSEYLKELLDRMEHVKFETDAELAQKAGVNQGSVSRFRSGKKADFNFNTVWKIFIFFGIDFPSIDDIVSGNHNSNCSEKINKLVHEKAMLEGKIELLQKQLEDTQSKLISAKIELAKKQSQPASQEATPKKMAG